MRIFHDMQEKFQKIQTPDYIPTNYIKNHLTQAEKIGFPHFDGNLLTTIFARK